MHAVRRVKGPPHILCNAHAVQVARTGESEKYLGRKLSLDTYHDTEIANRLASGWACFFKLKDTLCNRRVALRDRLKLFEACVSPCILYACSTWTMTANRERLLTSARRRMLRWIVRVPRKHEEDWV